MRSGVLAVLVLCIGSALSADRYVGKSLGALSQLEHGVRGNVFAVDARTLYIQGFFYDGEGPAAYFYVGSSGSPSATGATRLRDDRGSTNPLRKYRGEGIALSLPDNLTLKDVRWFAVWCDEYSVNFGDVRIPRDLEYPKPAKVGALRGVHGVSSDPVVVVDAQTLLVPNFSYDGEAPDAKFWVGRGSKPSPAGVRIPDENGKEAPLRKYDRKTIVLTLPGELTVFDIGHFGVWCEAFTVDFGHVQLPREQLANVPPSLKMLGVSPQSRNKALAAGSSPGSPRATPRRPIAKVDATTYRPTRLGAGPLAALLDSPAEHFASLHRRAGDTKPPQQQLLEERQQYQTRSQESESQERQQQFQAQRIQQQEQLQNQQRQQEQNQQRQQVYQQQVQQTRPSQQFVHTRQQFNAQVYNLEQLQEEQRRNQQQLELLQQLYQQQQRQQQLYQQGFQPDPERYQLVPYQGEFSQRFGLQRRISQEYPQDEFNRPGYQTVVDPIQRSIDLDLFGRPASDESAV
ncbi:protein Skeletor, isoforms B/C isoform X5 [Leguminivora glycinivorella]|uniref:protein Skeletor, isoforms B/C isoform X5 n=1 Tax=Leguminivora glycinivorella TaxID=1035111 RepID=UPI00200D1992|nr:protein Skeletor, isoforms B/C isoform X5 [Leguminivora glycinivorella]